MNTKQKLLTNEQRAETVRIAIEGGNPRNYIEKLGFMNPEGVWYNVKQWYKKHEPSVYDKIPRRICATQTVDKGMPKKENVEKLELDGGKNYQVSVAETPEKPKITAPLNYSGFAVRGVEGKFGSYHFQDINGKQWIDYYDLDKSNDLSMTVDQWRGFLAEIKTAAQILGVEL